MDEGCVSGAPDEVEMTERFGRRGGDSYGRSSGQQRQQRQQTSFESSRRTNRSRSTRQDYDDDFEREDNRDTRQRFERKSYGGRSAGGDRYVPEIKMREIHVRAPAIVRLKVPVNSTVGDVRHILGGQLSQVFDNARTRVSVIGGGLPTHVSDDYMVAGAEQFNASKDTQLPVFHFELPDDTHYDDFADRGGSFADARPRFAKHGGAKAVPMTQILVSYPHHMNVQFDAADDSFEAVARSVGEAAFGATEKYYVYDTKKGGALKFHLAYGKAGTNTIDEHFDHRHGNNSKASFVLAVDEDYGGHNGSGASELLFHAIPHHQ